MKNPAAPFSLCVCLLLCLVGCGSENNSAPSARLSASPSTLAFTSSAGQTALTQTTTITNSGTALANFDPFTITGTNAADFSVVGTTCASYLGTTASCTVTVGFVPSASGPRTATLNITSALTVALSGTAASAANVTLTPSSLSFVATTINQTAAAQTLTVTNTGGTAATLATPTLSGAASTDFAIKTNTCGNAIAGNSTCTYGVTFTPTATGTRAATFTLSESSVGVANTYTAALSGSGLTAGLAFQGTVLSGTQPIQNASIQLYTVGATGSASAAHAMLSTALTTNAAGNFYLASGNPITLAFTCTNATDQVYAVATGGNAGLTPSTTNNAALAMVAALGSCGNLTATSAITINELTTAAAAWTLAQFASSPTNIGATSTNAAGLRNAMLDAQLLANSSTGAVATVPSNLNVEPGKLAALADALASCTQTNGTGCTPLFTASTPTGGTAPTNTFTAALNIVKNPSQHIADVYALLGTTPPYATSFTQAPNDWTLNMAVSGGAIHSPTALAIDATGNVWAADYAGLLSGFNPQGTPLSTTGFGSGKLDEVYGLTIDSSGNFWATNQVDTVNAAGSVTKLVPAAGNTFSAITVYRDASISYPVAISADTNGDVFIANYATSAVTVYTSAGVPLASHGTGLGSGSALGPVAVAADANHGVWIANSQNSNVTHVSSSGTVLSNLACCPGVNGSNGVATDSAGNAWVSAFGANAFSVITTAAGGDGVLLYEQPLLGAGLTSGPAGLAVDSAQNVFVANFRGQSITELAGIHSTQTLGTILSPSTGFGQPVSGGVPRVLAPEALVPDASGNLWVTNNGNDNLIVFFGLAAPTKTPTAPTPVAP